MTLSKDQELLVKLYECQDIILESYNNDKKYLTISKIVTHLENKIINDGGFVGI
jgi:hypothetical protein